VACRDFTFLGSSHDCIKLSVLQLYPPRVLSSNISALRLVSRNRCTHDFLATLMVVYTDDKQLHIYGTQALKGLLI
jgi:hypothetical protein